MLDAFIELALEKAPRNLGRLADSPVVQSDVARRGRTWLGACLPGGDPQEVGKARTTSSRSVSASGHARGRLHPAIHRRKTADWVHKAAGTSAIFLGTPFERRFRDIHTLSQQVQSREAHFESVGRIMFNGDPDGTFM